MRRGRRDDADRARDRRGGEAADDAGGASRSSRTRQAADDADRAGSGQGAARSRRRRSSGLSWQRPEPVPASMFDLTGDRARGEAGAALDARRSGGSGGAGEEAVVAEAVWLIRPRWRRRSPTVRLHAEAALLRRLNAGAGFARSAAGVADLPAATRRCARADRRRHDSPRRDRTARRPVSSTARSPMSVAAARAPAAATSRLATMTERAFRGRRGGERACCWSRWRTRSTSIRPRAVPCAGAAPRSGADAGDLRRHPRGRTPAALVRTIAPGRRLRRGRALVVEGRRARAATLEVAGPGAGVAARRRCAAATAGRGARAAGGRRRARRRVAGGGGLHGDRRAGAADRRGGRDHGDRARPARVGPSGAAAHRLASAIGRPLVVVPVPALLALETRTSKDAAARRRRCAAARLRGAVPMCWPRRTRCTTSAASVAPEHIDAIGT